MPVGRTARRLAAGIALALAGAATPLAGAATIAIDAERRGDTIDIHASAPLKADAETAWRVLTAYDRYPEFIPDLRTSRVVARHGAIVTVEQSGDARVWLLPLPLDITFEIVELPPSSLRSRAVSGSLRALESSYELTPAAPGMRLDYVGHVAPGFELFGSIELQAVKQNVARQFQALADEIERQSAAAPAR
jgi:ribosome-associated toxin RatA of RatAB toxin-antitoxin module